MELFGRRDGQAHRSREPCQARRCAGAGELAEDGLKPSRRKDMWCRPPGRWRIRRPHGRRARPLCRRRPIPTRPVVCFDESPVQLDRRGAPADAGRAGPSSNATIARYRRNGTVNLLRPCLDRASALASRSRSPSGGRLKSTPTACANWSMFDYPDAACNPRRAGQPVDHAQPAPSTRHSRRTEARRASCAAVEFHFTPRAHASWLNMVEEIRNRRAERPMPRSANR